MPRSVHALLARTLRRTVIGWRFAAYILLISSCITLALTVLTLALDYQEGVQDIEMQMQQIQSITVPATAQSVWNMDRAALQTQANGVLQLPNMESAEVRLVSGEVVAQAGRIQSGKYISREFALTYTPWPAKDKAVHIATLRVVASLDTLIHRILRKVQFILVTQGIKTFLVSLSILALFQWLVGRHLKDLAATTKAMDGAHEVRPLQLHRTPTVNPAQADELDQLVTAINTMNHRNYAAQQLLRRAEERQRLILDSMLDGVITLNAQGSVTSANPAAQGIFGLTAQQLTGTNIRTLVPDLQELGQDSTLRGLRGDGQTFPLELRFSQMPDTEDTKFVLTVRDITEREKTRAALEEANAELKRSNADLQQFAYLASHDLAEPLRSVSSCVQLLQLRYASQLDARANEFIEHAVGGSKRMQALIQDLLHLSRLETKPECKEFALEDALELACLALEISIQESQAKITHDVLPTAYGHQEQIVQLLQNLVGNALKFRGDQAAAVHIGARHEGKEWVISVTDQGIGIEPQYFHRIFEVFQRLHTREQYSGTGIGLSMCKKIVDAHGGRIWVESAPGKGSTFFFTLPDKAEGLNA